MIVFSFSFKNNKSNSTERILQTFVSYKISLRVSIFTLYHISLKANAKMEHKGNEQEENPRMVEQENQRIMNNRSVEQTEIILFHSQVTSIKLNKENYNFWQKEVLKILKSYDYEGFATGATICPPRITLDHAINFQRKLWVKQDQMIGSWLIITMNDEFVKKVSNCLTSVKIWACLESYFLSHSHARIMQYKEEMSAIKMDAQTISEYV